MSGRAQGLCLERILHVAPRRSILAEDGLHPGWIDFTLNTGDPGDFRFRTASESTVMSRRDCPRGCFDSRRRGLGCLAGARLTRHARPPAPTALGPRECERFGPQLLRRRSQALTPLQCGQRKRLRLRVACHHRELGQQPFNHTRSEALPKVADAKPVLRTSWRRSPWHPAGTCPERRHRR